MLKAIRSTLFILSFGFAIIFTLTSLSCQEKSKLNETKVPVTLEKNMDDVLLQIERLQALQDCRNLMGMYSYYHSASRHIDYVDLWAKRADDCLEMPWGIYDGYEGVRRCYLKDHSDRTDPGMAESMKGGMFVHEMDTEVLVVADDGKTARGCWITPGHETFVGSDGAVATWSWGKYAADFIKEDGVWKIWHMRLYPLFLAPYDKPWTEVSVRGDILDNMRSADRPPSANHWGYSTTAIYPADQPEPPKPYRTFDDVGLTFIDPKK